MTGLILPAELRTPAQVWADRHWGSRRGSENGCTRGRCGISASARTPTRSAASARARTWRSAPRRSAPGTASTPAWARGRPRAAATTSPRSSRSSRRATRSSSRPAALVWHWYAEDVDALRRQAYGYGAGLTAYLAKVVADDPIRLVDLAARAPAALAHARGLSRSRAPHDGRPADLRRLERRGMAGGAAAYTRGRLLAPRTRAA